ncbi:MAG TPA: hypothetical protein VEL03_16970 [Streptosporangiaceae bacterium]|nr:hypothetical protein [Streptosporangiaceae bacterium]
MAIPAAAYAATSWTVAHPPYTAEDNVPYAPLNAISAISSSNIWAVGQSSGTPLIDHYNGSSWSQSTLPSGPCSLFEADCNLTGVSGSSASDVIAIGNGTIPTSSGWQVETLAYQYNGSAWSPLTVPASIPDSALEHIQVFSPTNAWAVGTAPNAADTGSVVAAVNWNGSTWTQVATPFSTTVNLTVNAISGDTASDIWVVGETATRGYTGGTRTSVILHYNGSAWTQVAAPDNSGLLDVDAVSPTDAWAIATDGAVLNWNGTAWSVSTTLELSNTAGIAALSPSDVWVAQVGQLANYNGTSWTTTAVPSGINVVTTHAVVSPGYVWFAGYYYPENAVTAPAVLSTASG